MEEKQNSTYQVQLSDFPKDMIQLIVSFLDTQSLINFRLVNRYFELLGRYAFLNKATQKRITQIAAGYNRSYLAQADGRLYAWGYNIDSKLGLAGNNKNCVEPQVITALNNVVSIIAGNTHTLAITQNGTLYAWGYNGCGQLGLGDYNARDTPQVVTALKDVVRISAGYSHTLAVTKDGTLYAWGFNTWGQLGIGQNDHCNTPQMVTTVKDPIKISAGDDHTLAITKDGTLYTWGRNDYGQLGLGHNNDCDNPQVVTALKDILSISAGQHHTLAITKYGTLYTWGRNNYGQLGLGHNNYCNTPQEVTTLKDVMSISAGHLHTLAITKEGILYAWGYNEYGQLGLGHNDDRNNPQVVTALTNVVSIIAGHDHTLAMTKDGTPYAWGLNDFEQLGLGCPILTKVNTPKQISHPNTVVEIINSITKREYKKRKLADTVIPPEMKQALLNELETFLPLETENVSSYPSSSKFFEASKREKKWAQGLKDVITEDKHRSIESIENEIDNYDRLNRINNGHNKESFNNCLIKMIKILAETKKTLIKPIENELYSMLKKQ